MDSFYMVEDSKSTDKDGLLKRGRDAFQRCSDAEQDNRRVGLEDLKFAEAEEQWPPKELAQRIIDGRPALTINKLKAFKRQVVNDARQNKPSIKVRPVDSGADKETAEVMNGLIRNIEYTSNADVAYDTAVECAVSSGVGYWRIGLDYAYEDSFDMDLSIDRVLNRFSVYGDPDSTSADSSDWNVAFVVDRITKDQFKAKYGDKAQVDWDDATAWTGVDDVWYSDDTILVAEWWERTTYEKEIAELSDGAIVALKDTVDDPDIALAIEVGAVTIKRTKKTRCHKVTQRIMSGIEVLEENEWPGRYIPIVPAYGDEFDIEGKRYFRSLIHSAIGAQQMYNFWRTASTEMVALAPRVPFIGPVGAFDTDADKWATVNQRSWSHVEYDGHQAPIRLPLDSGPAAGALQEALNASDDMKAVMGIYDASLGARSNETSGKAIMARQREGDVSTFHFIDNLSRAIRHTGRILIDLIPKIYDAPRIVRIIGEDGTQESKHINQEGPVTDKKGNPQQEPVMGPDGQPAQDEQGNPLMKPIMALHDLTSGKYDLTVTTGPSYTTKREEAAASMTEMIRAFPPSAQVVGPLLAKNLDWPGADEIAEKLEALTSGQVPPELQKQMEEGKQQIEQLTQENQQLKMDTTVDQQKAQTQAEIDQQKLISQAELQRQKIEGELALERYKIEQEMQLAQYKAQLDAQIKAQSAAVAAEQSSNELAHKQQETDNKKQESDNNSQVVKQLSETMTQLMKTMNSPKTIVRDPKTGKAVGVQTVQSDG
jgi:hypothetical protein